MSPRPAIPALNGLSDADLLALNRAAHQSGSAPPSAPASRPASPLSHLSDAELLSQFANGNPNMPVAEDVGRSGVTGLERGVTGLLGIPHALGDAQDWLTQHASIPAVEYLTGRHLTPQQRQQVVQAGRLAQSASPFGLVNSAAPSAQGMNQALQSVAGPYHDPQTAWGRFAETAGEMVPNALMPGGVAARIARVAVPAIAAQGAAELAPDQYKPAAKFTGSLAGGLAEGGVEGVLRAPETRFRGAMGAVSPEDLAGAARLRQHMAGLGADITIPEAVQQVTGGATDLGNMQRLLESLPRTRGDLAAYFARRPAQVSGAVNDFVAPLLDGAPEPGVLASRAQGAASAALSDVRQGINAGATPSYEALAGQQLPEAHFAQLAADPGYAYAARSLENDPVLSSLLSGQPNDLANVNQVVKHLDTLAENTRPNPVNPFGDATKAGMLERSRALADALASDASPDWRAARDAVASGRQALLEPLQGGPVGDIAAGNRPDLGSQTGALYPNAPFRGQPDATAYAVQALGGQDPAIPSWLAGQHIAGVYDQAARTLQGGENQFAGARFASRLMGNPTQADTLRAGLDAIDPSGALSERMQMLAQGLQATGQRMPKGSLTAFNAQEVDPLLQAPAAVRGLRNLEPWQIPDNLSHWLASRLAGRNLDALSGMIRDPDTAAVLSRVLSARAPGSAQYLLPAASQADQQP